MDTCAFLKNTTEHVEHLMLINFQELYDHIDDIIKRKSNICCILILLLQRVYSFKAQNATSTPIGHIYPCVL